MNFKPNKWKVFLSIILGLLMTAIATTIISQNCIPKIDGTCPLFSEETFYYLMMYFFIPIIIVIYIIWGLIEKK